MSDEFSAILSVLAEDKRLVTYRPRFVLLTNSVHAAILLSQVLYWWDKSERKPFYKFKQSCNHKAYKPGDSWCEELEWNSTEFDSALRVIGTKVTKGISKKDLLATEFPERLVTESNEEYCARIETAISRIVIYWTDSSRITHYAVNERLLGKLLTAVYLDKTLSVRYLKRAIASVTQKKRRAQHTLSSKSTAQTTQESTTDSSADAGAPTPPSEEEKPAPSKRKQKTPKPPTEWQQMVGLCMDIWQCESGRATRWAQLLSGTAKSGIWAASKLTPGATVAEVKGWLHWVNRTYRALPTTADWLQEDFLEFRRSPAHEDAIRDANAFPPAAQQQAVIDAAAAAESRARKDALVAAAAQKLRIGGRP